MIAAFCGAPRPATGSDESLLAAVFLFVGFCLGVMLMAVIQYHRKH